MKKYVYYLIAITALLIYTLGVSCGYSFKKCPPCPEPKCPELISKIDTIIQHDTVKKYIPRKQFVHSRDTIYDTIADQSVSSVENCLAYEDSVSGAHYKMTICSKELPRYKPLDLHGSLELSLPADTQRTYRYVDTIKVVPKSKWIVLTLGPYAGYGFSGADAGIGISLGLKLKEW